MKINRAQLRQMILKEIKGIKESETRRKRQFVKPPKEPTVYFDVSVDVSAAVAEEIRKHITNMKERENLTPEALEAIEKMEKSLSAK